MQDIDHFEGTRSLPKLAAVFQFLHRMFTLFIPNSVREFLDTLLAKFTPRVPIVIINADRVSLKTIFWTAYFMTFLFCFIGTTIGTAISGTLIGTSPKIRYFLHDWQNIVNYTIICPLYVSCAVSLIFLTLQIHEQGTIRKLPFEMNLQTGHGLPFSFIVFTVLFVSICGLLNFVSEFLNPKIYPTVYWFIQPTSPKEARLIGLVGSYYIIMNYTLLVICILSLFFFFNFIHLGREIGRAIKQMNISSPILFSDLRDALEPFMRVYLCSKGFVMVIMLNVYTWAGMEARGSLNMAILIVVLGLIGLILVPFPRYYVQLKWYEFNILKAQAGQNITPAYEDLRTGFVQGAAQIIDYITIAGILNAVGKWVFATVHL